LVPLREADKIETPFVFYSHKNEVPVHQQQPPAKGAGEAPPKVHEAAGYCTYSARGEGRASKVLSEL